MEHHANLEKHDEELSIEHAYRAKAEKSRSFLKKDIEDFGSRLEEAATQVELNKKREKELEEIIIAHKGTFAALTLR